MKTRLFKIAHSIKGQYETFAAALTAAWKVIKLRMKLKSGVVSFSFKKVDGSMRKAVGTLKDTPAALGIKALNYSVLTFFDVEAQGWRSSRIENLIF